MKRVVQFSGGLCSFFAAKRVCERYADDEITFLFADTLEESAGLYRFALHAVAYLQTDFNVEFMPIMDGRNIWQVFKDEKFLGNSRIDPCSRILKRELCRKWMEDWCHTQETVLYVGISWDEDRIDEIRERWKPWIVEAPMCEPPFWSKCDMIREAKALNLPLSEAYEDGFPHDNCGGGCIKAGQAQFAQLYKIRPAVYDRWEKNEADVIAHIGKDVSILKDRRGGTTKPMTLAAFRERIETGDYDHHEWGGCGCGV